MNPVERVQGRIDSWQRGHRMLAVIFGVVKKYSNDRGGQMAAMLAYYGFLSLFPLLLILVTVLGFALTGDPGLQHRLFHSALADFPLIGEQLRSAIHPLRGQGAGLAIGLVGLTWGALGVTQAAQSVMADVWHLPVVGRPGFWPRLARGAGLLGLIGLGLGLSTTVGLATFGSTSIIAKVIGLILAAGLNVGLYLLGLRLLTPARVCTRDLVPGAILGGIGWQVLQIAGGYLVGHTLRHSTEVYGTFGVVLGLVSWLYLGTQLAVYAAELNVVLAARLWPVAFFAPPPPPPPEVVQGLAPPCDDDARAVRRVRTAS